jgi:hypothetical protein
MRRHNGGTGKARSERKEEWGKDFTVLFPWQTVPFPRPCLFFIIALVAAGRATLSVLLCGQLPVPSRSVQSAHCTAQTYRVPTATGRTQLHWIAVNRTGLHQVKRAA